MTTPLRPFLFTFAALILAASIAHADAYTGKNDPVPQTTARNAEYDKSPDSQKKATPARAAKEAAPAS